MFENSLIKRRAAYNIIFKVTVIVLTMLTLIPLIMIIFFVFKKGIEVIDFRFLTSMKRPDMGTGRGGILPPLVGTLILMGIAGVFSVPIGIGTGIFLAENQKLKIAKIINWIIDIIQGIPSIVLGIVGYLWFVLFFRLIFGLNYSALAGGLTLGIMMLPMIVKTTTETVKMIPYSLKEAALSLGVPYYKTILFVVVPSSLSGIVTGILLSISRVAGETAPVLFTAFGNPYFSVALLKPIDSLPHLIYNFSQSPFPVDHRFAWGASLVLVSLVLIINLITRVAVSKWKIRF